jgi:catechol 2,3-dioxygenase-like lactoylglutathione lyase family enzyme
LKESILKIEHVAYNVPEASKMAKWYVEHLGLTIVRDVGGPNQITFLADDSGKSLIELYTNKAFDIPDYTTINPYVLHIAFSVVDIEAEIQRLQQAGAKTVGDINTSPSGDKLVFMRDPWGFPIQLAKRSKPMIE